MGSQEDDLPAAYRYARRQLRERLRDLRAVELEHRVCLLTAEEYANVRKSILHAIDELRLIPGVDETAGLPRRLACASERKSTTRSRRC